MKKLSTVLFVAAGLFATVQMTSCKKDKKEEPASLVGTWMGTTNTSKVWLSGVLFQDTSITYKADSFLLKLNADKSYSSIINGVEDSKGTYNTSGSKIMMTYTATDTTYTDTAEYTLTNSALKISFSGTEDFLGTQIKFEDVTNYTRK
jgi:hypothetical protein